MPLACWTISATESRDLQPRVGRADETFRAYIRKVDVNWHRGQVVHLPLAQVMRNSTSWWEHGKTYPSCKVAVVVSRPLLPVLSPAAGLPASRMVE